MASFSEMSMYIPFNPLYVQQSRQAHRQLLMFGRSVRLHFDQIQPNLEARVETQQYCQKEVHNNHARKWDFQTEKQIYEHNYQLGQPTVVTRSHCQGIEPSVLRSQVVRWTNCQMPPWSYREDMPGWVWRLTWSWAHVWFDWVYTCGGLSMSHPHKGHYSWLK